MAVCSEESKTSLVDLESYKISKCRPGHDDSVLMAAFSND